MEGPGGKAATGTVTADGVVGIVKGPGCTGGLDGSNSGFGAAGSFGAAMGVGGGCGEVAERYGGRHCARDITVAAPVVVFVGSVEPACERDHVSGRLVHDVDGVNASLRDPRQQHGTDEGRCEKENSGGTKS